MPAHSLHDPVLDWYAAQRRDLPWRATGVSAWGVLVSEVMLQQTPVARVVPIWTGWMQRWPTPAAQAAEPPGGAVRAWGRLGYPRRALRLHAAAAWCVARHGGELPTSIEDLRALPGVGEYTAAAVASFAFRQRHPVLDTNVRRVLARAVGGSEYEPAGGLTALERRRAMDLLPDAPEVAATWGVAVMELGALVCGARTPLCSGCPIATECAWRAAGWPAWDGPARRGQTYAGTDRQVRGRLLAVVREAPGAVTAEALDAAWAEPRQRARALDGLVADGLVEPLADGTFALPG
jgi:A/G-specific adenine glycosylase